MAKTLAEVLASLVQLEPHLYEFSNGSVPLAAALAMNECVMAEEKGPSEVAYSNFQETTVAPSPVLSASSSGQSG